ncbi:preprotein translocase subunit SecD [Mycobacterium shigaense]|uniref:preprotein translocase subunit SecD n=1 Tax=Mycobacterium shigaense TaxID=722731 RepID=UPI001F09D899|nr:preprotein translocase subunit SecD [Mycobacterium shigaense]MEA1123685.1 preprotein translocase subunit SecD [Mycobacterium shigaense]
MAGTSVVTAPLVGAVLPAAPATSTAKPPPATTQPAPRVATILPLPVRPVQKSQPTSSHKCLPVDPSAPTPPASVLTCDLARATLYMLGPESMRLGLTRVDPPKPLTSDFYEVNLVMNPASTTTWTACTNGHPHDHIAFVRDDLVLEAPIIQEVVSSCQVALSTQTALAADQLAQLAGGPA